MRSIFPSLVLLLALAGCGAVPKAPELRGADPALLQVCPEPAGSAETNGELALWLRAYRTALRACNDQITTFKESAP